MVFTRLKILRLKVRITVFVMTFGVNADQIWMNGYWFYATKYGVLMMKEWSQKGFK